MYQCEAVCWVHLVGVEEVGPFSLFTFTTSGDLTILLWPGS